MRFNFKILIISSLLLTGLSSCATRKDILAIREELYYLRNQIQSIKQTTEENQKALAGVPAEIATQNAQILAELDSLDSDVIALQDITNGMRADVGTKLSGLREDSGLLASKLDDSSYRTGKLISKVETIAGKVTDISERIENRSGSPTSSSGGPAPTEIFNNAYRDMTRGNTELAVQGFQAFLHMYPQNEMADYCQYYLAEICYKQGDYSQAVSDYKQLISNYPRSQKMTNAMYKLGLCYVQLNEVEKARSFFNQVIQQYPNTEEALLARTKLQKLDQP